jgi:hypothetical protein
MLNSDDIAKLSLDDLWMFHKTLADLLVVRITKRSRELDALLSQLAQSGNGHPEPSDGLLTRPQRRPRSRPASSARGHRGERSAAGL